MSYAGAEANRAETGLEGRATGPEDRATEGYSQSFKTNRICSSGF